jgi:hypothetical protein
LIVAYGAVYPPFESSIDNGQTGFDLSGMPYPAAGFHFHIDPMDIGCGYAGGREVQVVGVTPAPPPTPTPPKPSLANLQVINSDVNPAFPDKSEAFVLFFTVRNTGGSPAGAFVAHLALDNNAQVADVNIKGLAPSETLDITWPFTNGLPAGDHFAYAYLDQANAVQESSKQFVVGDNVGNVGFIVGL